MARPTGRHGPLDGEVATRRSGHLDGEVARPTGRTGHNPSTWHSKVLPTWIYIFVIFFFVIFCMSHDRTRATSYEIPSGATVIP